MNGKNKRHNKRKMAENARKEDDFIVRIGGIPVRNNVRMPQ